MEQHPLDEGAWRRGWGAVTRVFSSPLFSGVHVIAGVGAALLVAASVGGTPPPSTAERTFAGVVSGVSLYVALIVLLWLGSSAIALIRQRNAARQQVRDLRQHDERRQSREVLVVNVCLGSGNEIARDLTQRWDAPLRLEVPEWVDAAYAALQAEVPDHAETFLVDGFPIQDKQLGAPARTRAGKLMDRRLWRLKEILDKVSS